MKCLVGSTLLAALRLHPAAGPAEESPLPQPWDHAEVMRAVARRGDGRPGVVLHVGDSTTYANPYGRWARAGEGRTDDDESALAWMHADADDDTDGSWLARADHPDGGWSYTACGGIRADEMLASGKNGMPSLAALLAKYRPQAVVLILGSNDASAGRDAAAYRADMEKAADLILARGVVATLNTIPPHPGREALARSYNEELRSLARVRKRPLIDHERKILERRPCDRDGTSLGKGDVHPTAERAGLKPTSAPTAENPRASGYLLRGRLSVRKMAEVRRTVFPGR